MPLISKLPAFLHRISSLSLVVVALCAGCQQEPTIKTYTVARTSPPSGPIPLDKMVDHILVAIVPQENKAWFFKLVGKKPAIERQKKAFDGFLSTVKLAASADDTPSWTLPEGWTERGVSKMRAATVLVPDSGGELQLAVSSLPLTIDWEDFLVPNVNRWLGQLQCQQMQKPQILRLAKQLPTADAESTVFHLAGIMQAQPMGRDPHAGLGIAPANSSAQAPVKPPANSTDGLKYEKPSDWLPGKMSMMRKAAFQLPSGEGVPGGATAGEVTVTSFPAGGGQMSDVATNVQRGAGQVGMKTPTGAELGELAESLAIAGIQGTYVELESPADAKQQMGLYVAMLEREGQVWFFKMIGNRTAVASQRAAFLDFLSSVRFE